MRVGVKWLGGVVGTGCVVRRVLLVARRVLRVVTRWARVGRG